MSSIFSTTSRHSHRSKSGVYTRPSASRSLPNLFGTPSSSSHHHHHHSSKDRTASSSILPRGLFGSSSSSKHHSSSSSYKRRPRDGYIAYLFSKLKRLIHDLWKYARRHPLKAFLALVVPLISAGGAIGALLRSFGVGVPLLASLGIGGGGGHGGRGTGYYGSSGYDGVSTAEGAMGTIGQVMKIAQAFV
ncbi:hypothetical protein ANO11243_005510 [Dothideomycetidae sp. 11243]|nr:hypothetical protein ANO11243_005510 [fungal sp. No.11243]